MGYAGTGLDQQGGAVIAAPMFVTVGGTDTIKLSSVVPVSGLAAKDIRGKIEIQTLNNDGTTGDEDYYWDGATWCYMEDDEDASDIIMDAGKGYWVYNYTGKPVTFQSAGQVNGNDIVRPLDLKGGAIPFVNGLPTQVTLADFVVEMDLAAKDIRGKIEIQTLNNDGTTGDEDYYWDGATWCYMDDDEDASEVSVAAGKGFWVYNYTGKAVGLRIANTIFGD